MSDIAKIIIASGFLIMIVGIGVHLFGKIPGVGRLPGDIFIKKENFTAYVPITTCLLISLILSILAFLWNQK